MAGKTYIGVDDIAKIITKGYIGIDGKARKITRAYIGVDGIAQQCYQSGITVNVTGSGSGVSTMGTRASWIEINGKIYANPTTLQLQPNTVIKCCCIEEYGIGFATIILNGSVVAKSSEYTTLSYDYIIKENVEKITIELDRDGSSSGGYYGIITITEGEY